MVKKPEDDWRATDKDACPKKYLDKCKNFLVGAPDDEDTESTFFNARTSTPQVVELSYGVHDVDIRCVQAFRCAVCKAEANLETSGKRVIANPFSRAEHMLVCGRCAS